MLEGEHADTSRSMRRTQLRTQDILYVLRVLCVMYATVRICLALTKSSGHHKTGMNLTPLLHNRRLSG